MTTAIAPRQARGYSCRKDENPYCDARVRIAAEPLEAHVEGYVIDQWRNPEAIKIAQSDDDRMARIREITDEMRHLQEQKKEALRMKLRAEVDAQTFREVTGDIDAAHDDSARCPFLVQGPDEGSFEICEEPDQQGSAQRRSLVRPLQTHPTRWKRPRINGHTVCLTTT